MFIFYYAVLSEVSPPTALSAFAAAAITGGNGFKTMMLTCRYTLPAFLVPFAFILAPKGEGLLLQGGAGTIAFAITVSVIAVIALGLALEGYLKGEIAWPARVADRHRGTPAAVARAHGDRDRPRRPRGGPGAARRHAAPRGARHRELGGQAEAGDEPLQLLGGAVQTPDGAGDLGRGRASSAAPRPTPARWPPWSARPRRRPQEVALQRLGAPRRRCGRCRRPRRSARASSRSRHRCARTRHG